jgi:hypothetical protein
MQHTEQLFKQVVDTFASSGQKMDNWTAGKYNSLLQAFQQYGKLTDKQMQLLARLPEMSGKYHVKSTTSTPSLNASTQTDETVIERFNALVNTATNYKIKLNNSSSYQPFTKEDTLKFAKTIYEIGKLEGKYDLKW